MYKTSVPCLVAHNREDKIKPIRTLALNGRDRTVLAMTAFIRAATIPIVVNKAFCLSLCRTQIFLFDSFPSSAFITCVVVWGNESSCS